MSARARCTINPIDLSYIFPGTYPSRTQTATAPTYSGNFECHVSLSDVCKKFPKDFILVTFFFLFIYGILMGIRICVILICLIISPPIYGCVKSRVTEGKYYL